MEDFLTSIRERYWAARKLVEKYDQKKERYTSKVEGQTSLTEMRSMLTDVLNTPDLSPTLHTKLLGMAVVIAYDLGIIALKMGDTKEALSCLDEVLAMIPDKMSRPSPNFVLLSIEARNVFGAEYFDVNPKVAAKMVDEADKIYYNYRKVFPKRNPYSNEDHFAEEVHYSGGEKLVEAHSLTKFYLRQYSRPVTYFYKSLRDCYATLRVMTTSKITDLSSRAEIAIILGEYFINEREFHYGRYLLCIAAYIIDKYERSTKKLETKMKGLKIKEKKEEMSLLNEANKKKLDQRLAVLLEMRKNEGQVPGEEDEILVEVEEREKEDEPILKENEILIEVEGRKEEKETEVEKKEEKDEAEGETAAEAVVGTVAEAVVETVAERVAEAEAQTVVEAEANPLYRSVERNRESNTNDEMDERKTLGTWIEYEEPTVEEEIKGWRAFLARAWVKYGLHLMKYASQTIDEPRVEVKKNLPMFPKIKNLDLSKYEKQVTDQYPKTAEEAAPLFLYTQYKVVEAKEYYTLFLYPHEHVALAQEHSLLIRYMMKYENDEKALRKYLKARIRMLEPLSLQMNYKYYMPACRLLWFELGKCYHELLLLQYDHLNVKGGNAMRKTVERINHYCSTGMVHLHNYIDSFRNKNSKLPNPVPPEAVAKLAFAHFYLGRMYHSYITFDQDEANDYTLIAFSCFRYVVKHCEKDEAMMEALKSQYEMLNALRVGCYKNKLLLVQYSPGV